MSFDDRYFLQNGKKIKSVAKSIDFALEFYLYIFAKKIIAHSTFYVNIFHQTSSIKHKLFYCKKYTFYEMRSENGYFKGN